MSIILLLLVVAFSAVGCQQARIGPTASGHFFWLESIPVPGSQFDAHNAEFVQLDLIVSVENGRGLPTDGVLVEFSMASDWQGGATLSPTLVRTQGGKARAVLQVFEVGRAPVTARVENMTHDVMVNVSRQEADDS